MIYSIYLVKNSGIEPTTLVDTFDLDDPSELEDFTIMQERLLKQHVRIAIIATLSGKGD